MPLDPELNQVLTNHAGAITSLQRDLAKLRDSGQSADTYNQLSTRLSDLQSQVAALNSRPAGPQKQAPLTIDDVQGQRVLQWLEVDVDFEYGAEAQNSGATQVGAEGPLVVVQLVSYWQCLDDNDPDHGAAGLYGRHLPTSGFYPFSQQAGSDTLANLVARLAYIPELNIQFQIEGTGRLLSQAPVPAAVLFTNVAPAYAAIAGWINPTDRLIVHAQPVKPIPHIGRLKVIAIGYQILSQINLSQLLGYA